MDIWEQNRFNRYIQYKQSVERFNEAQQRKKKREIENIPQPYSPIRSDDMPLSKLLAKYPKFRYRTWN